MSSRSRRGPRCFQRERGGKKTCTPKSGFLKNSLQVTAFHEGQGMPKNTKTAGRTKRNVGEEVRGIPQGARENLWNTGKWGFRKGGLSKSRKLSILVRLTGKDGNVSNSKRCSGGKRKKNLLTAGKQSAFTD